MTGGRPSCPRCRQSCPCARRFNLWSILSRAWALASSQPRRCAWKGPMGRPRCNVRKRHRIDLSMCVKGRDTMKRPVPTNISWGGSKSVLISCVRSTGTTMIASTISIETRLRGATRPLCVPLGPCPAPQFLPSGGNSGPAGSKIVPGGAPKSFRISSFSFSGVRGSSGPSVTTGGTTQN